jgi:hypothetical protein
MFPELTENVSLLTASAALRAYIKGCFPGLYSTRQLGKLQLECRDLAHLQRILFPSFTEAWGAKSSHVAESLSTIMATEEKYPDEPKSVLRERALVKPYEAPRPMDRKEAAQLAPTMHFHKLACERSNHRMLPALNVTINVGKPVSRVRGMKRGVFVGKIADHAISDNLIEPLSYHAELLSLDERLIARGHALMGSTYQARTRRNKACLGGLTVVQEKAAEEAYERDRSLYGEEEAGMADKKRALEESKKEREAVNNFHKRRLETYRKMIKRRDEARERMVMMIHKYECVSFFKNAPIKARLEAIVRSPYDDEVWKELGSEVIHVDKNVATQDNEDEVTLSVYFVTDRDDQKG